MNRIGTYGESYTPSSLRASPAGTPMTYTSISWESTTAGLRWRAWAESVSNHYDEARSFRRRNSKSTAHSFSELWPSAGWTFQILTRPAMPRDLRKMARGQECYLRIPPYCNGNP